MSSSELSQVSSDIDKIVVFPRSEWIGGSAGIGNAADGRPGTSSSRGEEGATSPGLTVHVLWVQWGVPVRIKSGLDREVSPGFRVQRNECSLLFRRYGSCYELILLVSEPDVHFLVTTELRNAGDLVVKTENSSATSRRQVIWTCNVDDMAPFFTADGEPQLLNFKVSFRVGQLFSLMARADERMKRKRFDSVEAVNTASPRVLDDIKVKSSKSASNDGKEDLTSASILMESTLKEIIKRFSRSKMSEREPKKAKTSNEATNRMSYQNNADCLMILAADLLELYEDCSHHDVKLRCEGQTILAHGNILSARSKVLRDKLEREDNQDDCLEIEDLSFPVLQQLLRYIYTGCLSHLTAESVAELSDAANKYAVPALRERCENFSKNPRSSQNDSSCLQSLSIDLHGLYKDESGRDVKLRCGEESTSAHRNILSARSSVFKELLEGGDGRTDGLEVKEMDISVLQQFLRYVYTGILSEMTDERAVELLKAADNYQVAALKERCKNFLKEH